MIKYLIPVKNILVEIMGHAKRIVKIKTFVTVIIPVGKGQIVTIKETNYVEPIPAKIMGFAQHIGRTTIVIVQMVG